MSGTPRRVQIRKRVGDQFCTRTVSLRTDRLSRWSYARTVTGYGAEPLRERILDECRAVMDDRSLAAHQRSLKLFELTQDRNDEIANAFNDMRRSRAVRRISWIKFLDLLMDEEWERFGPRTRETRRSWRG